MKVLIIEDEALTANRLQSLLYKYDPTISVLAQIPSVKESINWLEDGRNAKPDLIFLDIHLEDDLGFKIIEKLDLTIPVVFTTAYNEYMLKAFKANSIDYLLKPIDPTELAASINKFKKIRGQTIPDFAALTAYIRSQHVAEPFKDRFMASAGTKLYSIPTEEIAFFTFEQKATFLKTFDGKHLYLDYSLDKLSQILDPNRFFRINRSVIISLSSIKSISTLSAGRLKIETQPVFQNEVFVSADRIADFKQWLGK
jgi:DNA-binding LytR/AlgR family response regulator